MTLDPWRLTLLVPFPPVILVVSDELFLLRVDRDDRIPSLHLPLHTAVDMLKLSVPIDVLVPLFHLAVALETVFQLV
jgi:hypothetical protein